MKKNNITEMSYTDLVAKYNALQEDIKNKMEEAKNTQEAIKAKREEEMKRALETMMTTFSATQEEMIGILDRAFSTTTAQETLALPEPKVATPVEMNSIWDHPALQEPYTSQTTQKTVPTLVKTSPVPVETSETKTEETLPTMAELLSDVPEYKALYTPKAPQRNKNSRTLPTFEDLLSDDPTNRILCLGNENPKGASYRQHTRINHIDGIIPTETATGKTLVYIPKRPSQIA